MQENNRFQKKKLNKENGKGIKKAAKCVKDVSKITAVVAVAIPVVKKFGKPALELGKKIIFRS